MGRCLCWSRMVFGGGGVGQAGGEGVAVVWSQRTLTVSVGDEVTVDGSRLGIGRLVVSPRGANVVEVYGWGT